MPVTDLIKVQFGQEATFGACAVATAKLMGCTDATLQIVDEVHQTERSDWYYPSDLVAQVQQMGEGSITLDLSYEDILYPLDNFFDEFSPTKTGSTTTTWEYDAPAGTTVTPNFLDIEFGAPNAQYEACGVLFTELNISGEAGGIWTGTFPFIASQVATGSMASLTDRAVELIRMADTTIYIDTWTHTGARTEKATTLISFDLNVNSNRHLKQFAASLTPEDWGDGQWTGTLTTVLEFNATGKAFVDALLAPGLVQRMIRIAATSAPRAATIDFYGTLVNGVELFSDRDGNITVSLEWAGTYNDTDSQWLTIDIVNLRTVLT